jgi:hypothetical protein
MKDIGTILEFSFDAPAELIVEETGERWQCRIKELSIHGCYLNAPVTLKIDTPVIIKIFSVDEFLRPERL